MKIEEYIFARIADKNVNICFAMMKFFVSFFDPIKTYLQKYYIIQI